LRYMRSPRPMIVLAVVAFILAACGGGSDQVSDQTSGQTSVQTETTSEGSEGDSGSNEGGTNTAGANSINYTISGSYEASGEQPLIPAMSFFDSDIWTMTFGDLDGGGSSLLVLNLDPSTPSINFTDGTFSVSGTTSECAFDITRQDASGAAGSFDCSGAPGVALGSGTLTQDNDFSGSFDASP
jgi:hypothetical protein